MFVATTLALSLVLSSVTALTQAPLVPAAPTTAASAAAPATKPAATTPSPAAGPTTLRPATAKPADAKPAAAAPGKAGGCAKLDYRARVEVEAAENVAARLRSKAEQELKLNDIMLGAADGVDAPVMIVKVVPLPGEDEGFRFTIDINHADHSPIKDGSSVGECPLCTESELLDKVVGATRALAPKLRAYVADYNNRPCKASCSSDAECTDPGKPRCDAAEHMCVAAAEAPRECSSDADCKGNPNGDRCHPVIKKCARGSEIDGPKPVAGWNGLQKAGLGLGLAGAAAGIAGAVLLGMKDKAPDQFRAWEYTTTKPPGTALVIVGATVLVAGVVVGLLGVRKNNRRSQVTPVAGGNFYGLSWTGRF
jgi:hypothetical protein